MVRSSVGCSYLIRVKGSSVGSALPCFKAGQGSIIFSALEPMEVLLAERISDEETSDGTSKCMEKGKEDPDIGKVQSCVLRLPKY
jgi:hypothetical protein